MSNTRTAVRYGSLFERLVANTHEPQNAQACWIWLGEKGSGGRYGRLSLRVHGKHFKVQAHIAMFIVLEAQPETPWDFYLAWQELKASGLELDHLCNMDLCCAPDHLEAVTPSENCKRRDARNSQGYA